MKEPSTIEELIYNSYARLAMLDDATKRSGAPNYAIREAVYRDLIAGKKHLSDFMKDNFIKMSSSENRCYYCGRDESKCGRLTIEHIIPRVKNGGNTADNILPVCKTCNSSKGDTDLLKWYSETLVEFPSVFVLRQYLRLVHTYVVEHHIEQTPLEDLDEMDLPFDWHYIPIHNYPNKL